MTATVVTTSAALSKKKKDDMLRLQDLFRGCQCPAVQLSFASSAVVECHVADQPAKLALDTSGFTEWTICLAYQPGPRWEMQAWQWNGHFYFAREVIGRPMSKSAALWVSRRSSVCGVMHQNVHSYLGAQLGNHHMVAHVSALHAHSCVAWKGQIGMLARNLN